MNWVFGTLAITLGIVFVWGLFAPRSQWLVLTSWSVANPRLHEPGGATYGFLRLFSGIGVVGLLAVVAVVSSSVVTNLPQPAPPRTSLQIMWGDPEPTVVNRYFVSLGGAPEGLVAMPVLGYQVFDPKVPDYMVELENFSRLGQSEIPGYLGTDPDEGYAAIDFASLVVHVRGPILCIPREVVVIEGETTVQIGVYYGLPDPDDGSVPDNLTACSPEDPLTGSVLIPVQLGNLLGDRELQSLEGVPIDEVRVVE